MSTTACWATNKSFDCAWVYYGYGSRHDMMISPGFWLSLEGICILAEYDYDYLEHLTVNLNDKDPSDRILADKLGLDFDNSEYGHVDIPSDMLYLVPTKKVMESSAITISHPDGIEKSCEWFNEVIARSGKIYKTGYKEEVSYYNGGQLSTTTWSLPSGEAIKRINPLHYEYHMNVKLREKLCKESLAVAEKWKEQWGGCMASKEDIQEMLDGWAKEADEAHEEFKKKNIWEQL